MKDKNFPFSKARRSTSKEVELARKAIEKLTVKPRVKRGRPKSNVEDKYVAISIRLHPRVLSWVRRTAKKRNIAYQTLINELLLKVAA